MLPEKIRALDVSIGNSTQAGQLLNGSTYEFRYLGPDPDQSAVALLMIGRNGIGRLGYSLEGWPAAVAPRPLSKQELLKISYTPEVFRELVVAYLSTGAGIAGMQPKIMVPDRPTSLSLRSS